MLCMFVRCRVLNPEMMKGKWYVEPGCNEVHTPCFYSPKVSCKSFCFCLERAGLQSSEVINKVSTHEKTDPVLYAGAFASMQLAWVFILTRRSSTPIATAGA